MKRILAIICCVCILGLLCACSVDKLATEKLKDIDFTVVKKEDIPEELMSTINAKESTPFKVTYSDQGALYIAQGYGEQSTGGYSIEVKECFETKNAVYLHTHLIGPSKDEKIVEAKTYPYIVIKMEFVDKNVVFQ